MYTRTLIAITCVFHLFQFILHKRKDAVYHYRYFRSIGLRPSSTRPARVIIVFTIRTILNPCCTLETKYSHNRDSQYYSRTSRLQSQFQPFRKFVSFQLTTHVHATQLPQHCSKSIRHIRYSTAIPGSPALKKLTVATESAGDQNMGGVMQSSNFPRLGRDFNVLKDTAASASEILVGF